jgi:hypothetical protein
VCYLCGQPITPPTSRDHIPPLNSLPPQFAKNTILQKLLTTRVHQQCNKSYQSDEDYLVYTLLGFVRGSEAGNALYDHILAKYRQGESVTLVRKVLAEFEDRPGGLAPGDFPASICAKIAAHMNGFTSERTVMIACRWSVMRDTQLWAEKIRVEMLPDIFPKSQLHSCGIKVFRRHSFDPVELRL